MLHTLLARLRSRRALLVASTLAALILVTYLWYPRSPVIAFEIDPTVWADGGPRPVEIVPTFPIPPTSSKAWGTVVPNIIHYVLLAQLDGSATLDYRQYLAVRSALVIQRPAAIYIHYDVPPTGPWWEALKPHVFLNQVVAPTTIWGAELKHPAHRSDILRLYMLKAMGGVYLDFDIFLLRPLNELFYEPFTMGLEDDSFTKMGNAVVISAPNAAFIERWMMGYQDFRPQHYAYNGVMKPLEIARAHPEELRLLNETAFFTPQWWIIDEVFKSTKFDFDSHPGYTYHAWGSLHQHLKDLDTRKVLDVDTSFHRLLRRYMGERDLEIWEDHLKGQ